MRITAHLPLILGLVLLCGCETLMRRAVESLEVEGSQLRLTELGLQAAEFSIDLNVKNNQPFALPVSAFDHTLSLGDALRLEGATEENFSLQPGETETVQLPVTVRYAQAADLIASIARGQQTVPYSGEVGITFGLLGEPRRVALPLEGEAPVPRPPRISVADFDHEFSFTRGLVGSLTLDAEEETDRLGDVSGLTGAVLFNGESLASLGEPESVGEALIRVPWGVSGPAALRAAREALSGNANDVRLEGEMTFSAPWGPVKVPLNLSLTP